MVDTYKTFKSRKLTDTTFDNWALMNRYTRVTMRRTELSASFLISIHGKHEKRCVTNLYNTATDHHRVEDISATGSQWVE